MKLSLKELAEKLIEQENLIIFPHVNPDGDAIGSAVGLCIAMRKLGKKAWILVDNELALNLQFLDNSYCVMLEDCEEGEENFDEILVELFGGNSPSGTEGSTVSFCAMAIDCSEEKRFEKRTEFFRKGEPKLALDHHIVPDEQVAAEYFFINHLAAANAENTFLLVKELEAVSGEKLFDKELATALYTGIVTDSGNFQYSNTSRETFEIASELLDCGVDIADVSVKVYQSKRKEQLKLGADIMGRMEFFAGDRAVLSYCTKEMLSKHGADMSESDGTVEDMRSMACVEISMLLKEYDEGIKVSARSKSYADVNEICKAFGGGGHVHAAGCTLHMSMDEAIKTMKEAVAKYLERFKD